MKARNVWLVILGALVLFPVLFLLFPSHETGTITIDYGPLIAAPDAELEGEVTVIKGGGPEDEFQFRLATYTEDGKPKVFKDLMRARPYTANGDYGVCIRYSYFRPDGTLLRRKSIEPMPVISASCEHKYREEEFSKDDQKRPVRQLYVRANGVDVAAEMEQRPGAPEVWKHYRVDNSLAHIQETGSDFYRYTHFRKNGKDVWWSYKYTYSKANAEGGSGSGTVFFDWEGNVFEKKWTRHSLYENGYSIGEDSPPFPTHEDSYLRADGTVEYRQTWVAMYRNGEGFSALSKLEILAADGKTVERVITFEPQHTSKGYKVTSDVMTNGQTPPAINQLPKSMFHGFNVEIWDWKLEYKNDI